jgi:hypothetical protein
MLSFLLLLISTLQKNWRKGQNRSCLEARGWGEEENRDGEEIVPTKYAHE